MNDGIICTSQPTGTAREDYDIQTSDSDSCEFFLSDEESDWEDDFDVIKSSISSSDDHNVKNKDDHCKMTRKSSLFMEGLTCSSPIIETFSSATNHLSLETDVPVAMKESYDVYSDLIHGVNDKFTDLIDVSMHEESFNAKNTSMLKCSTVFSQNFNEQVPSDAPPELSFTKGSSSTCLSQATNNILAKVKKCEADAMKTSNNIMSLSDIKCGNTYISSLVACVWNSFAVKEIWCKSTRSWQSIAIIILTDYSSIYHRLALWSDQCRYAFHLCSGDVIYMNKFIAKSICNECVLGFTKQSQILFLGKADNFVKELSIINACADVHGSINIKWAVKQNALWFVEHHKYMCSSPLKYVVPLSNNKITFKDISDLCCGEVIHTVIKVVSMKVQRSQQRNHPSIVCVCNNSSPPTFRNLFLNGSACEWTSQFKRLNQHTWELRNIACCESASTDRIELHTTIFSKAECLFFDDDKSFSAPQTKKHPSQCIKPSVCSYKDLILISKSAQNKIVTLNSVSVVAMKFMWLQKWFCTSSSCDEISLNIWTKRLAKAFNENMKHHDLILYIKCHFKESNTSNFELQGTDNKIISTIIEKANQVFSKPQSMSVEIIILKDVNDIALSTNLHLKSIVTS